MVSVVVVVVVLARELPIIFTVDLHVINLRDAVDAALLVNLVNPRGAQMP